MTFQFITGGASPISYNLTINGTINQTGSTTNTTGQPTYVTVTGFEDGTYLWNVSVNNTYGTNTSGTQNFTILTQVHVPINIPAMPADYLSPLWIRNTPLGTVAYQLKTNANATTNVTLNVTILLSSPLGINVLGPNDIPNFYISFAINDSTWFDNISHIHERIYYNDANIPPGVAENDLRLKRYTDGVWVRLECTDFDGGCTATLTDGTKLYAAGVNTAENYTWANTSNFSTFGVGGSGPSSGGGLTVEIWPSDGETYVPLDAPIDIFFHTQNSMNRSSVAGNLSVTKSNQTVNQTLTQGVDYNLSWKPGDDWHAADTWLVINLTLEANTQYNITLNGSFDNASNQQQALVSSAFITGSTSGGGDGEGGGAGSKIGNIWVDTDNTGDPCTPDGTAKADYNGWCNDHIVETGAGWYYIGMGMMETGYVNVTVNDTFIETINANETRPWHTTSTVYLSEGNNTIYVNYTNNLQIINWTVSVGTQFDSAPPNVTISPSNGSQNVPSTLKIRLQFTEPMNTSRVYPGNFSVTLRDDPSTSITPTMANWASDNASIEITLPTLNASTWYRVEVNGTDFAGNPLEGCPCIAEFQTGASGKVTLNTGEGLDFSIGKDNTSSNNDLVQGSFMTNNSAVAVDKGPIPLDHIEKCPLNSTGEYAAKNSSWFTGNTYCIYTREGGYAKINIINLNQTSDNTTFKWFYNASGNSFLGGDKDNDGVPDKEDYCPDEPGDPYGDKKGCPSFYGTDSDGDGIPDAEDQCPYDSGPFNYGGCPPSDVTGDSDFDGIPDSEDDCPYEFGFPSPDTGKNGCSVTGDSDGDGIPDSVDACPYSRGPPFTGGCPVEGGDKDFDGIPDDVDQCPTEGGPPFTGGCPPTDHFGAGNDTDMDGVPNSDDQCPNDPGPPFTAGCPTTDIFGTDFTDKDRDGIPDIGDNCPTQAGPHMNLGCPLSGVNDTDVDGIPDDKDDCPKLAGPMFTAGCPLSNLTDFGAGFQDSDMDGVIDDDDACPYLFGPPFFAGCPGDNSTGGLIVYGTGAISDSDGDGILDSEDGCPSVFGPPFTAGCPIETVFGEGFSDTDGDGVPDVDDGCPKRAGAPFTGGCPLTNITGNSSFKDSDFDGTPDSVDDCPKEPGPPFTGGCPPMDKFSAIFGSGLLDKDNDGVPDFDDACPLQSGPMHYGGCPISGNDQDLDGINDTADKCPDLPGPPINKGCPQDYFRYNNSADENDNDRDGVPSKFDLCPNTPGPFDNDGCPIAGTDTDGDGIPDAFDFCPDINGTIFSDGCPPRGFRVAGWFENSFSMADKDTDGVPDGVDRCPDTWGLPFMGGCPFGKDTNGKAFSGRDNDADGINDTTDNCPGSYNPGQEDADSDGKGDICDFLDIELPKLGVVFEPGANIMWGPRVFFPENSSVNFNGSITNITNTTFNVFNMTLPPLGVLIDFEMNYTLGQDAWENFSAHNMGLDSSGTLIPTPGKNATAILPKNGFYVNFTKIYASVNFSKLVLDANATNITTDSTNMTTVNMTTSGVLLDIYFNETSNSAPLDVASTGLNPEYGLHPDPQNLSNPAGDVPYLQLNCSAEFTDILDNTTLKIPIPSGYDSNTMKINYFNTTSGNWTELDTIVEDGYAKANTSHCSTYAISGTETPTATPPASSGGGGGGGGSASPVTLISSGASEMTSTTYSNILITLSAGGKINKDRFVETSNTLAGPLLLTLKYPLPTDPTAAQFARTVTKVTGDVYALAAEASQETRFQYGSLENKLVIARGDLGVDSMAAVAYAKAKNIPILLVKPDELPTVTEDAISKMMDVKQRDIIIIGGPVAVSTAVEDKLKAMGDVKRIYGETRIETALALAKETYTDKNKVRVIVITDYANPKIDAVLMSYVLDAPLLYVKSDTLSPLVKDYITQHKETMYGPTKVVLMGVNTGVASEINAALG